MKLQGIAHGSINVTDTERALGFYRDLLGMTQLERPPFGFGGAWLDTGDGRQLHLIEADVPPDLGQHLAFSVADVDTVAAELSNAGFTVHGPHPVPSTSMRQAFCNDPDGNRVEFIQLA